MTAECCAGEGLTHSTPQAEFFPSRALSREDEDPPQASELFREAGLALAVPLLLGFLIALGSAITAP
jgi:hypothetical protein